MASHDEPGVLAGPVQVMLAKVAETIPGPQALPGGTRWEPKWDRYRMVAVITESGARLWSQQAKELTGAFPQLAAAAAD